MNTYRLHVRPAAGRKAAKVREIACADDGALLMDCFALLADWHEVEAWDGERLVCRLTRPRRSDDAFIERQG
jgi:hypothetical protein